MHCADRQKFIRRMTKLDKKKKKVLRRALRKANQLEPYRPGKALTPMDLMRRYYGSGVSYSGMSGGGAPSTSGVSGLLGEMTKIGGLLNSLLEKQRGTGIHGSMGISETPPPMGVPPPPAPAPRAPNHTQPPAPPVEAVLGRRRGRDTDDYSEPLDTQRQRTEANIVDGVNRTMEEGVRRWSARQQGRIRFIEPPPLVQIAGPGTPLVNPPPPNVPPVHSNRAPALLPIADGSALEETRPIIRNPHFTPQTEDLASDDEGIVVENARDSRSTKQAPIMQEPEATVGAPLVEQKQESGASDLTTIDDTTTVDDSTVTHHIPRHIEVVAADNMSVITEPLVEEPEDDTASVSESTYQTPRKNSDLFPVQKSAPYAYLPVVTPQAPSENQIVQMADSAISRIDDLVSRDLIVVPGNVKKKELMSSSARHGITEKMGIDDASVPPRRARVSEDGESILTEQRKERDRKHTKKQQIHERRSRIQDKRQSIADAAALGDAGDDDW